MIRLPILVAIALSSLGQAQSQRPSPSAREGKRAQQGNPAEQVKQEPAPDTRGTVAAPLVVRVEPTDKEAAQKERNDHDESAAKRWSIVLAILTAGVGILQWWVMRKQSKIADAQNAIIDKQTAILEKQAISLDLTNAHTLAIQRAWVSVDNISLSFGKGKPAKVGMHLKNSGNSPAFVSSSTATISINGPDEPLEDQPDFIGRLNDLGELFLVADQAVTFTTTFEPEMSEADYEGVMTGTKTLYVFGAVEYKDSLSQSLRRTHWAQQLDAVASQAAKRPIFSAVAKAEYNRAT